MMNVFFHDYIPFASIPVFPAYRTETGTIGHPYANLKNGFGDINTNNSDRVHVMLPE